MVAKGLRLASLLDLGGVMTDDGAGKMPEILTGRFRSRRLDVRTNSRINEWRWSVVEDDRDMREPRPSHHEIAEVLS
jgi:hypothetical protein